MNNFWNRFLLTNCSNETIQVLRGPTSYKFFHDIDINSDNQESFQSYWTRRMGIGKTDLILTVDAFFFT